MQTDRSRGKKNTNDVERHAKATIKIQSTAVIKVHLIIETGAADKTRHVSSNFQDQTRRTLTHLLKKENKNDRLIQSRKKRRGAKRGEQKT